MKRGVWNRLSSSKADQLAPLQFAYKAHRHTGSVFVTDDNMLAKLLQQTKYAQILFVDFTIAFQETPGTHCEWRLPSYDQSILKQT